jgi:hypothetical protein
MVSRLKLQYGAMMGTLSGKSVFCFLRCTPGSAVLAGEYVIRGPVQDPSYGPVAIMVRRGGRGAQNVAREWGASRPTQWIEWNCQPPAPHQPWMTGRPGLPWRTTGKDRPEGADGRSL